MSSSHTCPWFSVVLRQAGWDGMSWNGVSTILNTLSVSLWLGSQEFTSQQSFHILLTRRVKFIPNRVFDTCSFRVGFILHQDIKYIYIYLSTESTTIAYPLDLGQEIAFPGVWTILALVTGDSAILTQIGENFRSGNAELPFMVILSWLPRNEHLTQWTIEVTGDTPWTLGRNTTVPAYPF
jgi:hypothetical protein